MPSTTIRPQLVRIASACAAAAAGPALVGCGLIPGLQNDVFRLEVGDCLADRLSGGEITEAATVECAQPHFGEVFAGTMLEDGEYPGDAEVSSTAEEECLAEFESFVGTAYADSELDLHMLYPSKETWQSLNDREILCIAFDPAGDTTGSLSGASR